MTEQPSQETEVPLDHIFESAGLDFCRHVVLEQETHIVYCGLRLNQHPQVRLTIPEPKDGP